MSALGYTCNKRNVTLVKYDSGDSLLDMITDLRLRYQGFNRAQCATDVNTFLTQTSSLPG